MLQNCILYIVLSFLLLFTLFAFLAHTLCICLRVAAAPAKPFTSPNCYLTLNRSEWVWSNRSDAWQSSETNLRTSSRWL